MKTTILLGALIWAVSNLYLPNTLVAETVLTTKTNQTATPTRLSLKTFVELALRNHPALKKLQESSREQRNLALRQLALKELLLSVSAGLTVTDPVYNGSAISADKSSRWTFETTLTRAFPELGGIRAGVTLGHGNTSTTALDGSKSSTATPYVGLSLSLPLIQNALGRADRISLGKMQLALAIVDKSEEEANELLIQSLALQYYAWALASEKASMYKGFFERAGQYYNQILRRAELGIADQSDLMLARQNWLGYQTSWLNARQTLQKESLEILSRLGIATAGNTNLSLLETADTSLPSLKPEALVLAVAATNLTNLIPDLRVVQLARLALEQARHEADATADKTRPQLDLVLKGTKTASDTSLGQALSSMAGNNLYAGINFSLPLQNSSEEYTARAAQNALARQKQEFEQVILETGTSLSRYRLGIASWRQLATIAEETSTAAAGRVTAVLTRFQQGRATLNNLTDAQDAWARTRLQALETRHTLRRLELEFAALTDRLTQAVLPE